MSSLTDARDLAKLLPMLRGRARSEAVWLLGGLSDRRVVPTLIDVFLNDPAERSQAASGLSCLGGKRAEKALLAGLTHPEAKVREWAVYTLNYVGHERGLGPLLARAADAAEVVRVRAQAVESLGGILMCDRRRRRIRERVIALLLDLLLAPEDELVFWASYAVGVMRVRKALPLLDAIRRTDTRSVPGCWSLAEEAEWAMASIRGQPEPEGFPRTRGGHVEPISEST